MRNKLITSLTASIFAFGLSANGMAAESMVVGSNGFKVSEPLLTIGETFFFTTGALNDLNIQNEEEGIGAYSPVGILDGMGAFRLDKHTVRVFANHELLNFRGASYMVNGANGPLELSGSRLSYFDIDIHDKDIKDAGIAINRIFNAKGEQASAVEDFLPAPFATAFGGQPGDGGQHSGFSRFCSAAFIPAGQFNRSSCGYSYCGGSRQFGLEDDIYFTNEEDGGGFNSVGGGVWALDPHSGDLHHIPAFGRGAWENVTQVNTGSRRTVAFILADDTSPFDADDFAGLDIEAGGIDGDNEASPLYLYVGKKKRNGDFLERNGLANGKLFVFVPLNQNKRTPAEFNTSGFLNGYWAKIDNTEDPTKASTDGSTGYDQFGYPTQRNLWVQAREAGAFGFSRPEDVATNPFNGAEIALASTGVDTYVDGADTFGTVYSIKTNFRKLTAVVSIIYDGDADPSRTLRSPDNLDWADDGFLYIQEDEAEEDTLDGEFLFGESEGQPTNAVNTAEAGIVKLDPYSGHALRISEINRNVNLDGSIAVRTDAIDRDVGNAGEWETSGIIDVSTLFDQEEGSLFLFNVQAHGIEDQTDDDDGTQAANPDSRISDFDLREGGQLLFLKKKD